VITGFYSPLPPARTGVADYSASVLGELRQHGTVKTSPDTCDISLYHIGNNQLHANVYQQSLARPGVVVLHDALLHHFYLGSFRQNIYIEEFVYNYGEWAREEAESLWQDRALSAQDPRYFERPMLRRIASSALAVVVHNPAAARAVHQHSPATPVFEIPHFVDPAPSPPAEQVSWFRSRLNAGPNGFVFAIFGFLRESKRLVPALQAFQKLHRLQPETRLLVAGEFVSQDLERAASGFLGQPGVCRLPHLSEWELQMAAASVDCCLNLRYPNAGETSGIAMRLMAAGKPVIVTDGEEWSHIPDDCLLRIPAGPAEAAALFEAMALLSGSPEIGRFIGQQAASHVQRYHSLSRSGAEYWNLLCRTFASRSC